jgi:N-acetyl-alpha-D-muramate 1-phosphate uridylyltransferase
MSLPVAILCGGLGTRLYPVTQKIPKSLVEVLGEPFLAHQFRLIKASGIERAVLCVGNHGESLQQYAGDGRQFGLTVEYSFDGPVLLGTAGALKQAIPLLGDNFFVLYGDSYLPCDYRIVAQSFHSKGKEALMTVFHNDGQWDTSNVEMSDGAILAYDKKNLTSRMRYIDYGLGVFRASAFKRVPPEKPFDLADLYKRLLAEGQLAGHEVQERFYEAGSFQGIEELSSFLSRKREQ